MIVTVIDKGRLLAVNVSSHFRDMIESTFYPQLNFPNR
jgi:hypothetical protein